MRQKIFSVTIGIPAYNEGMNIGYLLNTLLNQRENNFALEKIIVYSDGSTDKTVGIAKKIRDKRLIVVNQKTRKGLAEGLNTIMDLTKSDVLVLLNADISIQDPYFIAKLTKPIKENKADVTSPNAKELQPRNIIEKMLFISMELKTYMFERYHGGNNIYTCHGQARAFSKKFYKTIRFSKSIGEDAFSYLYCKANKFTYTYVKNTEIFYKLPDTFQDHQRQSVRFFESQRLMQQIFGKNFVLSEYRLPRYLILQALISMIIRHPIDTLAYLGIAVYMKGRAILFQESKDIWEISKSSKVLMYEKSY